MEAEYGWSPSLQNPLFHVDIVWLITVRKTDIIKIHNCASKATQANLLQPPDDYQALCFPSMEVMRQILITQVKMAWILASH